MDDDDDVRAQRVAERLETDLRKVGLYVNHIDQVKGDGRRMIFVDATIGDVALSDRVQNPDNHDVKTQFRGVVRDAEKADFAAEAERLAQAASEGKSFFDDDEEETG